MYLSGRRTAFLTILPLPQKGHLIRFIPQTLSKNSCHVSDTSLDTSWNVPPVRDFFIGVLFGHLFLDAMTTMGAPPILDGRKRRITVFGGKLHTWSLGEFVTALITAFVFYAVIPSLTITKNWDGLYAAGIIGKYEYEQRKSALFGFLKKEPPAEEPLPRLP